MSLIIPSTGERIVTAIKTGLSHLISFGKKKLVDKAAQADRKGKVIWSRHGRDQSQWFEVIHRPDGFYSFAEWRKTTITDVPTGPYEHSFPLYESGLYKEPDQVVTDAVAYIETALSD